jgi:hypothetical protein
MRPLAQGHDEATGALTAGLVAAFGPRPTSPEISPVQGAEQRLI